MFILFLCIFKRVNLCPISDIEGEYEVGPVNSGGKHAQTTGGRDAHTNRQQKVSYSVFSQLCLYLVMLRHAGQSLAASGM